MTANQATDLVTKVGGSLSIVGMVAGAFLNSYTTCTLATVSTPKLCRNWLGEVEMAMGEPLLMPLIAFGGLGGAIAGAVLGALIVRFRPQLKADLFP